MTRFVNFFKKIFFKYFNKNVKIKKVISPLFEFGFINNKKMHLFFNSEVRPCLYFRYNQLLHILLITNNCELQNYSLTKNT